MKNVIIFGFGRMGLTHYAILNQLQPDVRFVFVDPNYKVNYFARRSLNINIVRSAEALNCSFDHALICTPPIAHAGLLKWCVTENIPNIFVEKPFGGLYDDMMSISGNSNNIFVGYVLRFNPIIQYVKKHIDVNQIYKVEGNYFSNTIEKKPTGWRNSPYSGVSNEVGSHVIDLCVYLFGLQSPKILASSKTSVISDVDDIVVASFEENSISYFFNFDWVNKQYRKPVFEFTVSLTDGSQYKFDQQKIENFKNGEIISSLSAVDLVENIPYYLRGVDFTLQMEDFIDGKKTVATAHDALITRNVLSLILA
jgi:predicted dehydrogenase